MIFILFKEACNMDCNMERRTLNKMAHQMVETLNPPIKLSAKMIIMALITSRNNPSVTSVIGSVRIMRIGLIKIFKTLKVSATHSAVT